MTNTALDFDIEKTRETIASNVAAELKRQRWTGRSAAVALGLSQPYVYRRIAAEVEMSGSDLAMFAAFLNVPVSRFFVQLPDLDSNQEPIGFESAAVSSLEEFRAAKMAAHSSVATDHDSTVPFAVGH